MMNRRSFLSTPSALLASPVLPAAAPIASKHMTTGKLIARSHNQCTTDILIRHLRIPPELATRIHAQLLRQGVITPPIAGVSMASNPTNTACITNEAMRPTNLLQKITQIRDQISELTDGAVKGELTTQLDSQQHRAETAAGIRADELRHEPHFT